VLEPQRSEWKPPEYPKTPEQYQRITAACRKAFVFAGLPDKYLEQIIGAFAGPQEVEPNTFVIQQGARVAADEPGLYVIEQGKFNVHKLVQQGDKGYGPKVATLSQPGQIFGELALLYDCARAATVIAAEGCIVWSLDRSTFTRCMEGAKMQRREGYLKLLASIELFEHIAPEVRVRIADALQSRKYHKNEFVVRRGDDATEFFIVEQGRVFALVQDQRVKEYGPFEYFGEIALLHGQPRSADVIAESPTTLAVLNAAVFRRLLGIPLEELLNDRTKKVLCSSPSTDGLPDKTWSLGQRAVRPTSKEVVPEDWLCTSRRCKAWNFGRADRCLRCGVQKSEQKSVAALPRLKKFGRMEEIGFLSKHVDIDGVEGGNSKVAYARYVRREQEVGLLQGLYPLGARESVRVAIHALGTFGEIAVGLSAKMSTGPANLEVDNREVGWRGLAFSDSQVSRMVGWSANELGCHGDHGRWYQDGMCPGRIICPAWEEGDVVEVGLTESGNVFMRLNGTTVLQEEGLRWPMEFAYPTVTVHSEGAEVAMDVRAVEEKSATDIVFSLRPAMGLRDALQRHEAAAKGKQEEATWRTYILDRWWSLLPEAARGAGCCSKIHERPSAVVLNR